MMHPIENLYQKDAFLHDDEQMLNKILYTQYDCLE